MALRRLSIASSLLTLLASSVLMTGCQYPDDDNASTSASPSSLNPDSADTRSYVTGVRSSTTPGVGGAEDTVTSVLSLVDDTTGAEVTTVALDPLTSAKVAQAFTVTADGYQAGRQTKAYYVYQHKLYEISLEHAGNVLSKPTARQVSNEANACEVREVVERDTSAQTSYLSYTTGGADGLCNTPADNDVRTALSSSDASTATGPAYIDVLRDSTGLVTRLVGIDANHKLVVIDASTQTATNVVNGAIPTWTSTDVSGATTTHFHSVTLFGKVAGTKDKIYLRVGSDVRTLDWSTSTLSATAVATLNMSQAPLVHTDEDATYYVDVIPGVVPAAAIAVVTPEPQAAAELVLMRLKPGQNAEKLASLGLTSVDEVPEVAAHAMTPSSLAMVIRRDSGDTLTVIGKDGSKRDVALSGSMARVGIQAHLGEVLVISQQSDTSVDTSALTRLDLGNSDHLSALSAAASLVTVINGTSTTIGGEVPSSYLLWSESGTVRSHNLGGNNTLTIANNSTLTGWNGGTLSATVSNLTVGLLRGLKSATPNAESLWLFNAAKAVGAN